jgi:hypothetical protein
MLSATLPRCKTYNLGSSVNLFGTKTCPGVNDIKEAGVRRGFSCEAMVIFQIKL